MDASASTSGKSWKNKRVLVTGINGFIGGNLTRRLLSEGAIVTGIDINEDRNSMLRFDGLADQANVVSGDICDRKLMEQLIRNGQFDACFHLAAQVEVGVALLDPFSTFESNIRGTYTLLDAIKTFAPTISAIVVASTDKAYGSYPAEFMPYREDYPLKPEFPYDTSKACADMIAQSYANDFFKLPIVVTRFCNIFGPGQLNFSALIPDAIQCGLGYKKFVPRGNGSHIRDFIFSEDVADLYLRIADALAESPELFRGKVYNAGANEPRSVRSVLEQLFEMLGKADEINEIAEQMKYASTTGEIDTQYMDFMTVKRDFGWEPKTSFTDGLQQTIDWFKLYLLSEKGHAR